MLAPQFPKMAPTSQQKTTQNQCKNEANKELKKDRLETVLGRYWVVLSRLLDSKMLMFHMFFKSFSEKTLFQNISLQEPSWTELGTMWLDFGSLWATFLVPKTDNKKMLNVYHVFDRFLNEKRTKKCNN